MKNFSHFYAVPHEVVLFQTLNAAKLENLKKLGMSDHHRAQVRVFCGDPMKTALAEK